MTPRKGNPGHSAADAVAIAKMYDGGTGGPVRTLTLDRKKRKKK